MNNKYIDGHAHLNTKDFKKDIIETLNSAKKFNVTKIIMPSTCVEDSLKSIQLAKKNHNLFAAIGIHPNESLNFKKINYLDNINPQEIIAIGEVGIDLYRKDAPPYNVQKQVFEKHIKFAKKHNKILIIHMREAADEVCNILKKYLPLRFVMHSFTDTYAWALKFIKMGGYISFSGIVTFKNAQDIQKIAKKIPLNKILTETDAPFLTPVPKRGQHNLPSYVKYITDFIAKIRNEPDDKVINQIYINSKNLYNI